MHLTSYSNGGPGVRTDRTFLVTQKVGEACYRPPTKSKGLFLSIISAFFEKEMPSVYEPFCDSINGKPLLLEENCLIECIEVVIVGANIDDPVRRHR